MEQQKKSKPKLVKTICERQPKTVLKNSPVKENEPVNTGHILEWPGVARRIQDMTPKQIADWMRKQAYAITEGGIDSDRKYDQQLENLIIAIQEVQYEKDREDFGV